MWNILVLTVMASLTGYYMMANKNGPVVAIMPMSAPYAESMAMYREAVITWFSVGANRNVKNKSVSMTELKSVLPSWSGIGDSKMAELWHNYRDSSGIIYVFSDANNPPPVNISTDLLNISHQSALVSIYSGGKLLSLSRPDPSMPDMSLTPPSAAAGIANGSLVWVASIR